MITIIGFIFIITGAIGGLYVGGWLMFIEPILEACKAFDAGTLTGLVVGITVLKCFFASTVGWLVFTIGLGIGQWFIEQDV